MFGKKNQISSGHLSLVLVAAAAISRGRTERICCWLTFAACVLRLELVKELYAQHAHPPCSRTLCLSASNTGTPFPFRSSLPRIAFTLSLLNEALVLGPR